MAGLLTLEAAPKSSRRGERSWGYFHGGSSEEQPPMNQSQMPTPLEDPPRRAHRGEGLSAPWRKAGITRLQGVKPDQESVLPARGG